MKTLANHLDDYLALRRQLGYKLESAARHLRNFVRFMEQQHAAVITTKLALKWATQTPSLLPVQKANRLGIVRRFAQYLCAIDPRTEVPAHKLLPYHFHRREPHRYRGEDVLRLMEAARQIGPDHPIKGASYATLIGLLAVTGMRAGGGSICAFSRLGRRAPGGSTSQAATFAPRRASRRITYPRTRTPRMSGTAGGCCRRSRAPGASDR